MKTGTTTNRFADLDALDDTDRALLREGPSSDTAARARWSGLLAPYGVRSGDGRTITGGIDTRPLPLYLRWQPQDSERHDGAVAVGRILAAGSREDVIAAGYTDTEDEGPGIYGGGDMFAAASYSGASQDAITAATEQMSDGLGLVSVDLVDCDGRFDGDELIVTSGVLAGATLVNIPAFATAKIGLSAAELAAAVERGTPGRFAELALTFAITPPELEVPARLFAVTGSTSLPIGPDRGWDGPRAATRMLDAASGEGGTIDVKAASRGFFWHDDDGSKRGDYKLPFADMVDGSLQVIPRGVSAVLSRLDSTDIPDAAKASIRRKAEGLQARIERAQDAAIREADELESPGDESPGEGPDDVPMSLEDLDARMALSALDERMG